MNTSQQDSGEGYCCPNCDNLGLVGDEELEDAIQNYNEMLKEFEEENNLPEGTLKRFRR